MPRIDAPTTHVLARLLIQADGPAEYPAVHALQDGFVITPLSQWNLPPQATRARDGALNMKVSPREQVESLPTDALFAYASELLRRNPARRRPARAGPAARRGLIPGRPFDFDKLDHPAKQGMRRGLRAARERMQAAAGATLREANGWQREAGGVGVYGNAYMRRALAAQAQPGASLPEDLATLLLAADGRARPWTARAAITCASPAASCRRPALLVAGGLRRPGPAGAQRAEPPGARQPRPAALQRGRLAGPGPRPRSARARAAVQLAAAAGLRTRAIAAARLPARPGAAGRAVDAAAAAVGSAVRGNRRGCPPPPSPATDADPTAAPARGARPIARPGRHGVLARQACGPGQAKPQPLPRH